MNDKELTDRVLIMALLSHCEIDPNSARTKELENEAIGRLERRLELLRDLVPALDDFLVSDSIGKRLWGELEREG